MTRIVAIADDLSGAAKTGAALMEPSTRTTRAPFVSLKVDSLLRGHLSSDLGALLRRGALIFAPSLGTRRVETLDQAAEMATRPGVPA